MTGTDVELLKYGESDAVVARHRRRRTKREKREKRVTGA
jgi:hypothetical protein